MHKILVIEIDTNIYNQLDSDINDFDTGLTEACAGPRKHNINFIGQHSDRCYYECPMDVDQEFIEECLISIGTNYSEDLIRSWEIFSKKPSTGLSEQKEDKPDCGVTCNKSEFDCDYCIYNP